MESESAPDLTEWLPGLAERRGLFDIAVVLESLLGPSVAIGETGAAAAERIRFRAHATLGFPAEEVARIDPPEGAAGVATVTVNLLGLHGPASPLPPAFTERILLAEEQGALRDFADLFNHRLVSLLIRIGRHYRHEERFRPGARDPISAAAAALFGRYDSSDGEDGPIRSLLLPYTGLLALESLSAEALAAIVGHAFGLPCEVEEFQQREISLDAESIWRLGHPEQGLGIDTICGLVVENPVGTVRIWLGPIAWERSLNFLPDGASHRRLNTLVRLCLREPLHWDLGLRIAPGEARPFRLSEGQLGWSSRLAPDPDRGVETVVEPQEREAGGVVGRGASL